MMCSCRSGRSSAGESASLDHVRGEHPAVARDPVQGIKNTRRNGPNRDAIGDGRAGTANDHAICMILEVAADAPKVADRFQTRISDVGSRTDTRFQQEIRRADGTGSEDDLVPGFDANGRSVRPARQDLPRPAIRDNNLADVHPGFDVQVPAAHRGVQKGVRGRLAPAGLLCHLIEAYAFRLGHIEIRTRPDLQLRSRIDEILIHRRRIGNVCDRERTVPAMQRVVKLGMLVGFRPLEIGKHGLIVPPATAEFRPMIIIRPVAADVDHPVDRGRTAEDAPSRHGDAATVKTGLRRGLEQPVVLAVL